MKSEPLSYRDRQLANINLFREKMKTWNQILKEAQELTNLEFNLIKDKEVKVKTVSGWWWFSDANKESFQTLVNSELSGEFLSIGA